VNDYLGQHNYCENFETKILFIIRLFRSMSTFNIAFALSARSRVMLKLWINYFASTHALTKRKPLRKCYFLYVKINIFKLFLFKHDEFQSCVTCKRNCSKNNSIKPKNINKYEVAFNLYDSEYCQTCSINLFTCISKFSDYWFIYRIRVYLTD